MARTFRLQRPGGLAIVVSKRGASWLSCEVPVASQRRSVVLRRAAIDEPRANSAYLGATIGRYANRIRDARIHWGDQAWNLVPHPAGSPHQLHGGPGGFHAHDWDVAAMDDQSLHFHWRSPSGDQGFPGTLEADVVYRLVDAMTLEIETLARVDAPCPVAITNHAYFNLDGDEADARDHALRIRAARYMPVDKALLPVGPPQPVAHTSFDFHHAKRIRDAWLADAQQAIAGGYDHAFLLEADCADLGPAACELSSSRGDLRLSIHSTLPALQFYAGQGLARVRSPEGRPYPACAAVALEPGFLPDSPNHPEWPQPSCWLQPDARYQHLIRYRFDAF